MTSSTESIFLACVCVSLCVHVHYCVYGYLRKNIGRSRLNNEEEDINVSMQSLSICLSLHIKSINNDKRDDNFTL